jgi:hypothetical protein
LASGVSSFGIDFISILGVEVSPNERPLKLKLVNSIISWVMKKRIRQIELFIQYPHEVQYEGLQRLLNFARSTEWGKRYHFSEIDAYETFQERLPINNYESLQPEIDRLRAGEQNILWPTEIKWFAKSSGTTSAKSKFIPVSQEALEECHFNTGKDMLSIYCNLYPETQLFSGKSLVMAGSSNINQLNDRSYYGDLSAILVNNLPFVFDLLSTPDSKIALIEDFEEKLDLISDITINENVTSIAGVPSWTLVLARMVLEKTGKSNLLEVWPDLELFVHGGVSFKPYAKEFQQLIPSPDMRYLETYNASEGFFAIQDQKDSKDLLLMLDYGIFYEFIPMSEYGMSDRKAIPLSEVELGVNYAIVITTNAGLWRYMIGDTVMFTCLEPFRILITGRTKHFINAFGEELIVENADRALEMVCSELGCSVVDYHAAPVYMHDGDSGAHEWIVEFSIPPEEMNRFTELLDNSLKKVNSDYEAKRHHNMALRMPVVHQGRAELFTDWLKKKNKLGGQNKVPRLQNSRELLEELLSMNS